MATNHKAESSMVSETGPEREHDNVHSQFRWPALRNGSVSISIPTDLLEPPRNEVQLEGFTDPLRSARLPQMSGPLHVKRKADAISLSNHETGLVDLKLKKPQSVDAVEPNDHLLRSGNLGMSDVPYCTTFRPQYIGELSQQKHAGAPSSYGSKVCNGFRGDAKGWKSRFISLLLHITKVRDPQDADVQGWNKFFLSSCLVAIFVDPLFSFVLSALQENKCIVIHWNLSMTIVVVRSLTDFIYILHMLLQFRLTYVDFDSNGKWVGTRKEMAMHYIRGSFFYDLFNVLPLPQIIVLLVLPQILGSSGANYSKNLLRVAILLQYIPRLFKFLPLLIGQSPSRFIFETARSNFVINLLMFVLSGHIVGSCWYHFGLQRVNQCLRNACRHSNSKHYCKEFLDCGYGDHVGHRVYNESIWSSWKNNKNAAACFTTNGNFTYGIYNLVVNLTTEQNIGRRYIYSFFWGFQQISTLAGNQTPSYFVWEIVFTMTIIVLGLLLFALLIGNMQNFLQTFGGRRLEMSQRRHNVDQWMKHRRLPRKLRRKVLKVERCYWAVTLGINEKALLDSFREDIQKDIRMHFSKDIRVRFFDVLSQVRIFKQMEMGDHFLHAICEKLKKKTHNEGSTILDQGSEINKMLFIASGTLKSTTEDSAIWLTKGDVCGEELLTSFFDKISTNKDAQKMKIPERRLYSSRVVKCWTDVEAFALQKSDLEEVISLFARDPRVQAVIRYYSPYWRNEAANRIQVWWRERGSARRSKEVEGEGRDGGGGRGGRRRRRVRV